MTTEEARNSKGVFGLIHANGTLYPKSLHGRITDIDRYNIEFTDNNGFIYIFRTSRVVYFRPKAVRRITWKMPKKFIV